MSDRRFFYYQ